MTEDTDALIDQHFPEVGDDAEARIEIYQGMMKLCLENHRDCLTEQQIILIDHMVKACDVLLVEGKGEKALALIRDARKKFRL